MLLLDPSISLAFDFPLVFRVIYISSSKSMSIAIGRLTEERKNWRKDHPAGFHAKPVMKEDGSTNIMEWHAG